MKVTAGFLLLVIVAGAITWLVVDRQVISKSDPAPFIALETVVPAQSAEGVKPLQIKEEAKAPAIVTGKLQVADSADAQLPAANDFSAEVSIQEGTLARFEDVITASPEELPQRRNEALSGDADAAFWMYLFFSHCDSQPRVAWQLERALGWAQDDLDRAIADNPDRIGDWQWVQAEKLEQGFALCSILGPDFDTVSASLHWLEIAADLGHLAAQSGYYEQARWLITSEDGSLVFQNPGLIENYKIRADTYAKALLRSGHPESLILMSKMLRMGDVYDRDLKMAHAYARAAELDGTEGVQRWAKALQSMVEWELPPSELTEADELARDLLDR
jgi:TPR repeat protein